MVATIKTVCTDNNDAITEQIEDYSISNKIPKGCEACGGPYPLCKIGCPVFDDE